MSPLTAHTDSQPTQLAQLMLMDRAVPGSRSLPILSMRANNTAENKKSLIRQPGSTLVTEDRHQLELTE